MPGALIIAVLLQVAALDGGVEEAAPAAAEPAPAPAPSGHEEHDLSAQLHISLFGDVNAGVSSAGPVGSTFFLGDLDLLLHGSLGEHFSALAEVQIEVTEEQEFGLDVERLQVTYALDERLTVTAGRVHQNIGRWNTRYHHGKFFFDSTTRPQIINFEDDGGLLPVHLIGVEAAGELWPLESLGLRWSLDLGNGRGRAPAEVLNLHDLNPAKSIGGQISVQLPDLGLDLGANLLFDEIPPGGLHGQMTERIIGGYLSWELWRVRLMSEVYSIHHQETAPGSASLDTLGGFVELGVRAGAFHPFVRGEYIDYPQLADAFYAADPQSDWLAVRAGVRWAAAAHVALKLEYAFLRQLSFGNEHQGRLQLAFGL